METVVPVDGMVVTKDTSLVPGVYVLPRGITVAADNVMLNGNGAVLVGRDRQGAGIQVAGRHGITIRNARLRDYGHGIVANDCCGLRLEANSITSTAEIAPNTVFLDVWRGADDPYGGAILLRRVVDSRVADNDVQHQQNGLLMYGCQRLTVEHNQASYNSGFGIHLYETTDSVLVENCADYCCRFEPREGGLHYGHMGADATGFLVIHGSSRNIFRRNTARLGGDGFFLAGLAPDGTKCGCDDNLFEENDGSLSPNIAFEATFCKGNVFRGNYADRSNYGFWLGYSWDTELEDNRMVMNRQAGIAVENGHGFRVRGNRFQGNGHGILLWSMRVDAFASAFPESLTSYGWTIEKNTFLRNGIGVRIAADQDHGIRPALEANRGMTESRPHGHSLRANDIQDNRVGIELCQCDETVIEQNVINRNVEANVRQDDCGTTLLRNNQGIAGGYL